MDAWRLRLPSMQTACLCSKEAEDAASRPNVAHHLSLKVSAVLEDRRIVRPRPAPSTLRFYYEPQTVRL